MSKKKKVTQKPSKSKRKQPSVTKPIRAKQKHPGSDSDQKPKPKQKRPSSAVSPQYYETQHILCVGEGNFSFARALVRVLESQGQGVVATAYDTEETVLTKYEEGSDPVTGIIQELKDCDATVCFSVNATQLAKSLQASSKRQHLRDLPQAFDRVIFNFPHVGLGIKDQDINVRKNQQMLSSFFFSACEVLKSDGEIHVTVKDGKPYSLWNIVSLAYHATQGVLTLKTTRPFQPEQYPGYSHRRTLGFKEGMSTEENEEIQGGSKTYVFRLANVHH